MADLLDELGSVRLLTRLPLRARRAALRVAWRGLRLAGKSPSFELHPMLRYMIRVSAAEAARLDSEIGFHDMLASLEWAAVATRSEAELHRDARAIAFVNPQIVERFASSLAPVIIGSLHMGCLALPFAKMMLDFFPKRPMLLLMARDDLPEETTAIKRISSIGVDIRFLNVGKKENYMEAVRFARAGAVIVTFVDLPASYGSPEALEFFGRPARLAMGLPSLARVTRASVIPISIRSGLRGDVVEFGPAFESYEGGDAEKTRVAGIISRHIEKTVLAAPEQWHMWGRLREFLDDRPQSEAA